MDLDCDVAVIGAGTAGLAAERSARAAGARTLLIDPDFSGTTCAQVGCMPSKLLIAAAHAAHAVRQASVFGITATPAIDGAAVMTRLRTERDRFVAATRKEIAALPDGIRVRGKARFVDATHLVLDDGRQVAAKAIVIATGARPAVPEMFEAVSDLVFTNETIFDIADLPHKLAVVGSGPLGLELAQAFARLGVAVTLLDKAKAIKAPAPFADLIATELARDMAVELGAEISAAAEDGKARLRWSGPVSGEGLFDAVLVTAGRPPALKGLDLDRTGLALDDHGVPQFDRKTMRCGESAIFIAGDASADRPVLHEASATGAIAGHNAARFPDVTPGRRTVAFSLTFTDPPFALIGETDATITADADYTDQGRAKVDAIATGMARLYADAADGRLRGAALFCPGADHLAHLLAWSIESGLTAADLLQRPFYHPTLEEGLKSALRTICADVGTVLPGSSDGGHPSGA